MKAMMAPLPFPVFLHSLYLIIFLFAKCDEPVTNWEICVINIIPILMAYRMILILYVQYDFLVLGDFSKSFAKS